MNNDGTADEVDEACEDVFDTMHEKSVVSLVQQADGSWCITYEITVENSGNEDGFYDLVDIPQFDPDFVIVGASYSSTVHTLANLPYPPPVAGWVLGNDVFIPSGTIHTYLLEVCVEIDLEDGVVGDDIYTACGAGGSGANGMPGEGLFNESNLDTNDDGIPDEEDEACADVPYFTLEKDISTVTQIGPRSWTVTYDIVVCNIGGADGMYDLNDTPCFDDDVVIDAASYTSDATANASGVLAGVGPWVLDDDQTLMPGACFTYMLAVDVTMDLTDPSTPGDEAYTACGDGGVASGSTGEGLYNKTALDTNNM